MQGWDESAVNGGKCKFQLATGCTMKSLTLNSPDILFASSLYSASRNPLWAGQQRAVSVLYIVLPSHISAQLPTGTPRCHIHHMFDLLCLLLGSSFRTIVATALCGTSTARIRNRSKKRYSAHILGRVRASECARRSRHDVAGMLQSPSPDCA